MNEMSNLYKTALHQLEISEDDQAVLEQVGYSLVGQADAFRKLQLVIFKKESLYSYSSLLGTSVEMEFDWDSSISMLDVFGLGSQTTNERLYALAILYGLASGPSSSFRKFGRVGSRLTSSRVSFCHGGCKSSLYGNNHGA